MTDEKTKIGKVYKFWMILLGILGSFSLFYFLVLFLKVGPGNTFNYSWLCLGILCGALILFVYHYAKQGKVPPKWVIIPVEILVGIGFLLFVIIEAIIVQAGRTTPPENADYIIILGAKVNGTSPSLILRYRIDAGIEYLRNNPDTMVIASGGQGADEQISEAQCIYNELVAAGIDPERILIEDRSTSTRENLIYSMEFLDAKQNTVVITTTDFHIFRSLRTAKECGYKNVWGNSADSVWWLIPTNYTREFLAVLKELIWS